MEVEYSKKNFLVLWIGQLFSVIGSGITGFALSVSVYQSTGMASYYALITLATVAPGVLIRPIAGALSDKHSRRKLMIIGYNLAGAGVLAIAVIMMLNNGNISIAQICLCMAISSLGTGISIPAFTSAISLLVPESFYGTANGLLQISSSGQYLVSPFAAGILLPLIGVNNILILNVLFYLLVVITIISIKMPLKVEIDSQNDKELLIVQIKEGFKYLLRSRENLLMVIVGSVSNFFMGFLMVLNGPMILSFASAKMLGIGQSIAAIGMLVGSVFVMIWKMPKNLYTTVCSYCLLMGLGYMFMGASNNYYIIILSCTIFFFTIPFVNSYIDISFRKTIDISMQGRVFSIQSALIQIGVVISQSIAGILADYIFEPMFIDNGSLVNSIGRIIGIGKGRGIAFMFILSGFGILAMGIIIHILLLKKHLRVQTVA